MAFWSDPTSVLPKQQHRWVVSFDEKDLKQSRSDTADNYMPYWLVKSVDKPSFDLKTIQAKHLYSSTFNFPTRVVWKPIKISIYDASIRVNGATNKNSQVEYYNSPYIGDDNIIIADRKPQASNYTFTGNNSKHDFSTQVFFYKFLQEAGYYNPEELSLDNKLLRYRKYTFKKDMIRALVGGKETNLDYRLSGTTREVVNTEEWKAFQIKELDPEGNVKEVWRLINPLISDVSFDKLDYGSENAVIINATIAYDWAELETYSQDYKVADKPASPPARAASPPAITTAPPPAKSADEEDSFNVIDLIPPAEPASVRPPVALAPVQATATQYRAALQKAIAELQKSNPRDGQIRIFQAALKLSDETLLNNPPIKITGVTVAR